MAEWFSEQTATLPVGAVDVLAALAAAASSVSVNGQKITNLGTPAADTDAATKAYVDAVAVGLIDAKASCRAATTANITLSGEQTVDGVSVIAGDRVLVKNQSAGAENGPYVAASGAWARAADSNTSAEVTAGLYVFIEEGSSNADTGWVLTTNNPITLGTTALTFVKFTSIGGDVVGPASSTDNGIPRYSGTGGKTLLSSAVVIDSSNQMGFGATTLTHAMHLATGKTLALYGVDGAVNFERLVLSGGAGSNPTIAFERGGTGAARNIQILNGAAATGLQIDSSGGTIQTLGSSGGQSGLVVNASTVGLLLSGKVTTTASRPGVSLENQNAYTGSSGRQPHVRASATVNQTGSAGFDGFFANHTLTAVGSAGSNFILLQVSDADRFKLDTNGKMHRYGTVTAAATTGAQTINKPTGTVNFAATDTTLVVTNSLVASTSIVRCSVQTNDTTMKSAVAVAGSGSFTIHANAAATAETKVFFEVLEIV